jgi:hypothetical protein
MSQEGIEGLLVPRQPPMGWARLREKLRDENGWIYRGQRSASWMLASTQERPLIKRIARTQNAILCTAISRHCRTTCLRGRCLPVS